MFEKNLNSINFEQSSDRQRLVGTSFLDASKNISAHKAQSGDFIIALNNVPLDDAQNPAEDAKNVFLNNTDADLNDTDIVVVFGLGLGYLLKRTFVSSRAKIILYEPNINVLRYAMEYVDFADVFSSHRFTIVFDLETCLKKVATLYFDKEKINLIFNKSYVYLYSDLLKMLSTGIIESVNTKKSDLKTFELHSKRWLTNFLKNFDYLKNSRPINYLANKFSGKTALILCAGPSLKENIELIKENKEKFLLISLNKNIDYLLQNGLTPDFVVASDGMAFLDKFTDDAGEYSELNFILSAKCAHSIFERKTKSLWMYFPENMSLITNIIKESDKTLLFDKTWGTTSLYAYECAKMLGVEKIVFAGLDLAFKNDERYSIEEKHYTKFIENQINFTTVQNVKGEIVQTRNDYALFVKQFEQAIKKYSDKEVYNISDFGAKIDGMNYVSLEIFIKMFDFCEKKEINDTLSEIFAKTDEKWQKTYEKMSICLKNIQKDAKNIKITFDNSENKFSFPVRYYDLSKEFLNQLKKFVANPILSDYFQYEILNFLHKLETQIILSKEEYDNLKVQENNFLSCADEFISSL